jgi:hypothetical protein
MGEGPGGGDRSGPKAGEAPERDLRIDFLRGLVICVLVVIHVEVVSLYTFLAWERVGLISGGEGFVILSGLVLGRVSRRRVETRGWAHSNARLVDRATQLYRVNLFLIASIALLRLVPGLDTLEVVSFTDRFANQTYPLYPAWSEGFYTVVGRMLLLRAGPHQVQILGLYVVLLLLTPLALRMLYDGRAGLLLAGSWALYFAYKLSPWQPTGAQFESAFPLLAWQVIYVHGLAAGYHREAVERFLRGRQGRWVFGLAGALFVGCFLFAQNTSNPVVPGFAKLSWVEPATFDRLRTWWFDKNTLGVLRILNYFSALLVGYALLARFWPFFHRALGWLLVPLGQASLYVFIVHVFLVLLVSNFRSFTFQASATDILLNTAIHSAVLLTLWCMVRMKFLFRFIPR